MLRHFLLTCLWVGCVFLGRTQGTGPAGYENPRLAILSRLIQDPSPKTRLQALRALAKIPTGESAALALSVLEKPMDPTLEYGLWLTINDLADPFIAALKNGSWTPDGKEQHLEFALKSIPADRAGEVLSQILASRPLDPSGSGPWIELIGGAGSLAQLKALFQQTVAGGFGPEATVRALVALGEAARLRKAVPSGELSALSAFYSEKNRPEPVRLAALRLAGQWKDHGKWLSTLGPLVQDPSESVAVQSAGFDTLRQLGDRDSTAALVELARSPERRISSAAVVALAGLDLSRAVPLIIEQIRALNDESAALEFWRAVLRNKGAGRAVADAMPERGIPASSARAGMRAAREGGRSDLDLVVALARSSGLTAGGGDVGTDLIRDLATKALASGDPYSGEYVFRKNETACYTCHGIGGAGGKVGPDLTSIGASAPPDYLVESVLLPNAKIKEGYHAIVVTTKDGNEHSGTLAQETANELILHLASGTEEAIAKSEIQKREQGLNSLMPSGLLESLNAQEQLDLFAFLSRLGKPGDFDASKGGVARKWHITQTVHTDGQAGQENWPILKEWTDPRWKAVYGLVRGIIPRQLLLDANGGQAWTSRLSFYTGTEVEVSKAGAVELRLIAGPGAALWVDGNKVGGEGVNHVELAAGKHRVLVQIDPKKVPEFIRLESADVNFVLN